MLITAKDIINKSVELYQKNYQLFLKYMLLLFIPTGIITIAIVLFGSMTGMLVIYGLSAPLLVYISVLIAATFASLWISLAFIRSLAARYENQEDKPIKDNIQTAVHLIIPAFLISLLTSLMVVGGLILLIIPGLIFIVWFAFTFYAVVIDNHKIKEAFSASRQLVKGRWWKVLWRLVAPGAVFSLILLLIQWLINIPLETIIKNIPENGIIYTILITFFSLLITLIGILFTPLTSAATVILYLELKKTSISTEKKLKSTQV